MRLIDADALGRFSFHIECEEDGKTFERCVVDWDDIEAAPTVEAVILPCKVRDSVWLIEYAYRWDGFKIRTLEHPMQRDVLYYRIQRDGLYAHFYDGCISTKYFGKTVFLTREEAEAALAERMKNDG